MGDLRVLRMARQSSDWPRHRVLHKSPHLKMLCSAAARTEAALGIFDIARHCAFTLFARAPACAPFGSPSARFPPKASLSSVHLRLYAANPPAPVIGEVRFVILRRTAFPLRVSKPCAPRLTRVSPRPARTGFASSSLSSLIAASRPMSRLHRMNRAYHMSSPAHLRASRHGINPFWTAS